MKALIVDLNNFSRYPTLSVGYLSAILKQNNHSVETLSPLFFGLHGFPRRVRESAGLHYLKFMNHIGATTTNPVLKQIHRKMKKIFAPDLMRNQKTIIDSFTSMLESKPDIVLISAYTMYFDVCTAIAAICLEKNIPLLVGGNSFVIAEIAGLWSEQPGISAVFAGEPENNLCHIMEDLVQGKSVDHYPGIYSVQKGSEFIAPPLHNLDQIPFPDFAAFPWSSYPNRIVPVMTGRGCEWGRCTFCSDVTTSAGRTYRSRSLDNVMNEIITQRQHYNADLFVFLDLKLNSNLELWRGLAARIPNEAPGVKWTASVHVDSRAENGLSYEELKKASDAGLVRITCGLESGSQKVLNRMTKGVRLQNQSKFIQAAYKANLSVRLTSIIGDPNEGVEDIRLTTKFLREHRQYIERIVINRFSFMPATPATQTSQAEQQPENHIQLHDLDTVTSIVPHTDRRYSQFSHRKAVFGLLAEANKINRKPLIARAREFEGAF